MIRTPRPDRQPTERETQLLAIVREYTDAGAPIPTIDDLADRLGVANGGTVPEMFRMLHDMGLIINKPFQRGRQVCLVETGKWSALPMCTAIPWRQRPKDVVVPKPSMETLRARRPDVAAQILTRAAQLGKPAVEYLADLVFLGFQVETDNG